MQTHSSSTSETCDLLVVGSGAAGLAAAVTAAKSGLQVILAEKEPVIGGTTAWSGGWIWAPCNPVAKRHGIDEDTSGPRTYLEAVLGNNFNPELVDAFLQAAPEMVGFFEDKTDLIFDCGTVIPDTYSHLPGAGFGGRSVIARPYDARKLGKDLELLRKPMRETTFWGMTIQAGPDLRAFMTVMRSVKSLAYVTRRVTRHLMDLAFYGRGMQLRNGNALVGRLLRSALDAGVDIRPEHAVARLIQNNGKVEGATLHTPDGEIDMLAKRGVVLASGGYSHDLPRRNRTFPHPEPHRALATEASTGDGLRLGEDAGGHQADDLASYGAWCPVSEVTWPDGKTGVFPHIIDRGKPGVIGVLADGKRFCNEGLGYHDYVRDMLAALPEGAEAASWLICDHRFLRRYGLGIVRPAPVPHHSWIKAGYLKTGKTIADLARACGIDPDGLTDTVTAYNEHAEQGEDPAFGRGTTAYMRLQGDPDVTPNPNVAPILKAPFYAVKVIPGSFGTFAGLQTDGSARVLDDTGAPIPGLYAAGTDMASVMGGHYPAGGINLGPALTFGFIAGRHAAESSS
ncbi:MAG: FAD-dependent oxidoreductase [Pseudomonadota bacterium]|nr:FAD-dependent oxidoreductase [Pseudomonadota bacterium]